MSVNLVKDIHNPKFDGLRAGFGKGLLSSGMKDQNIVALCADLVGSTKMDIFADEFPERFIEVGIAEQNLAATASGLAAMGKIPFTSSYAAFHPGRSWEQIKTTICMNNQNVKIVGSHTGVSVGPDGGTHQMFEDIALMRVLPRMVLICPIDSIEAEKATMALAIDKNPGYLRLTRESTPVVTTVSTPFTIGRAEIFKHGNDISLMGTGTMTYHLLVAADILAKDGIEAEVLHVPTVKPLDEVSIIASAKKTGQVFTAEEGQIAGGFGSAVAELLSEEYPVPVKRFGIEDRFGESGDPAELMEHFNLTGPQLAKRIKQHLKA